MAFEFKYVCFHCCSMARAMADNTVLTKRLIELFDIVIYCHRSQDEALKLSLLLSGSDLKEFRLLKLIYFARRSVECFDVHEARRTENS